MARRGHAKSSSRLRRWFRDATIIAGITLAILLALEGVLRRFHPQRQVATSIDGAHLAESDDSLGMRYVPGARFRVRDAEYSVEYAINRLGLRDARDHPVPKPQGTTRVLLLGDSFTFGQGVNYDDTWAAVAERRLEEMGREDIHLLKAGIQGADTRSELILLRRLLAATESDLVVVSFLINDLYTNVPLDARSDSATAELADVQEQVFEQTGERRPRSARERLLSLHLVALARRLLQSSDAAYTKMYLATRGRGEYLSVPLPPEPRRKLEITERLFQQMAAYCDSLGKQLIVLSIPQQFQVLYHDRSQTDRRIDVAFYDRHFADVASRHGFTWVATLEDFVKARRDGADPLFLRLDGHLTPAGNAVVADAFVQRVVPMMSAARLAAAQPAVGVAPRTGAGPVGGARTPVGRSAGPPPESEQRGQSARQVQHRNGAL